MKKYVLKRISFGSYIKLMALASFGTGLIFGLFGLLISLCGGTVSWNGQVVDYRTGIFVGLFMLIIFPLAWGWALTFFSMITFPMLKLGIKLAKGVKIKGAIESVNLLPMPTENVSRTVTVTTVERPARKLIFLRYSSTDYFAACEEVGCEWVGFYNSIPEKFDAAAGGRLPKDLIKPDTNGHAFFVEVPLDYNKPLPGGYEIASLPPCTYLYFNGMPFDNQNDFPIAIGIVNDAIKNYSFERFGWKRSENAPDLGMGAEAATGARTAVPVEKLAGQELY